MRQGIRWVGLAWDTRSRTNMEKDFFGQGVTQIGAAELRRLAGVKGFYLSEKTLQDAVTRSHFGFHSRANR